MSKSRSGPSRFKGVLLYLAVIIGFARSFRFEINNNDPVCIVENLPKNEVDKY